MGVLVKAPKCRNGLLKNHKSTIIGKPVEWKDGIAELSDNQWEVVKGIKGYDLVVPEVTKEIIEPDKPETEIPEVIEEIIEPNEPEIEIPEVIEEIEAIGLPTPEAIHLDEETPDTEPGKPDEPEVITGPVMIGEMVTMENTSREIREFAARQNPPVDMGKARTKIEMLREISKHFELK